jgi:hypothetical protein
MTGWAGSTGSARPIAVRTHPPSPSRSQYIGGSAPVSPMNRIYAPLATGVRSISNGASSTLWRARSLS